MTPFLSRQFISVHVRVMLVDIITLAVGTPGLPLGAAKISNSYAINRVVIFHNPDVAMA